MPRKPQEKQAKIKIKNWKVLGKSVNFINIGHKSWPKEKTIETCVVTFYFDCDMSLIISTLND